MTGARDLSNHFPNLGLGLGLRAPHFQNVLNGESHVDWFEVISENFMPVANRQAGPPLAKLKQIRRDKKIVLHGVSLNIGSSDPLNETYLKNLQTLIDLIEPEWVSDHFCWTGVDGENMHDLLPLPYTEGVISHLCERIDHCQAKLGRRLVFENVSSYMTYAISEMSEWDFVSEIAGRTGCGLLVDVNNIFVSSKNHGFDPLRFLNSLPRENVAQFHLAGHSAQQNAQSAILIDTHDHPVAPEVWELYQDACKIFGPRSAMVEWDDNLPSYGRLEEEIMKSRLFVATGNELHVNQ